MSETITGPEKSFYHQAARFSFWAPIAAIAIGCVTSQMRANDSVYGMIIGVLNGLLIIAGLVLAIVSLFGIKKYGKKRILGYAIVGIIFNGVLVVAMISTLMILSDLRQRISPMTAEVLQQQTQIIPGSTVIIDEQRGYRVEIPPAFSSSPNQAPTDTGAQAFIEPLPLGLNRAVSIEPMGGFIDDSPIGTAEADLMRRQFPSGATVIPARFTWGSYNLTGFEIQLSADRAGFLVQVPVIPEAIQVIVMGPPGDQPQQRAIMQQVLDSLKANSNWP